MLILSKAFNPVIITVFRYKNPQFQSTQSTISFGVKIYEDKMQNLKSDTILFVLYKCMPIYFNHMLSTKKTKYGMINASGG